MGLEGLEGVGGAEQVQQIADAKATTTPHKVQQNGNGRRQAEIRLGDATVPVYPQKHAYLSNRLGRVIGQFASTGTDLNATNFVGWLGGNTYDVLAALIPSLASRMPRHVFAGYPSAEAMEKGEYDEAADQSPTFPEIVAAFEAAVAVNRLDVLGNLKDLVDPTLLKATLRAEMSKALSGRYGSSVSSPQPSGESPPPSTGPTPPTSTE